MEWDAYHREACDRSVDAEAAVRRETYGDLDPDTWQTLCCRPSGARFATVFVGDERMGAGGRANPG